MIMKILEVINIGYPAGGAELNALLIRNELKQRGHDVRVLSSDMPGPDMFSDYQVKAIQNGILKPFRYLFYPRVYITMRRIIKEFGPDLIHFHTVSLFSPSIFYASRSVPSLMTVHGPEMFTTKLLPWALLPSDYKGTPFELQNLSIVGTLHYWYFRYVLRTALYILGLNQVKVFIAPSKYIGGIFATDVDSGKIMQVYNGIPLPERKELPKNKRILYVGRLEDVKGVEYLIRSFAKVIEKEQAAELHIVGDGNSRAELERLTEKLNLIRYISFKGWLTSRDQILKEYENALMLVIPSVWPENLPTVGIEALAVGRPIIGTDTGGIPELVHDKENGYIVPIKDPDALAEAISKIIANREQAIKMGEKSYHLSRAFSIGEFINRIENLYKINASAL